MLASEERQPVTHLGFETHWGLQQGSPAAPSLPPPSQKETFTATFLGQEESRKRLVVWVSQSLSHVAVVESGHGKTAVANGRTYPLPALAAMF